MSRFDRYLLSQLVALFGFFALILVAVYWVNRAVGLFDRLLGDGHSALVFLEFSLLMLPNVIRLVLPIAATAPLLAMPIAYWLEGDRPGKRAILGGLVAVAGCVALARVR